VHSVSGAPWTDDDSGDGLTSVREIRFYGSRVLHATLWIVDKTHQGAVVGVRTVPRLVSGELAYEFGLAETLAGHLGSITIRSGLSSRSDRD
jgi:hypothetical protein